MKVLLTIGSSEWVCESSVAASKIADALGKSQPVKQIYEAGSQPMVYQAKRDYTHDIRILEVTDKMLITSSQAKVVELINSHQKKETK